MAVVPPPAGISQFQRRTLPGNVFIWTGLARHARIAAITTTKRALPRSAVPSWLLVLQRLRDVFCMPALFWLCPRLFRGVTPYRHDGESPHGVVHPRLAHSGYLSGHEIAREPFRPLSAHVPYTEIKHTPPFDLTTRHKGHSLMCALFT